MGKAQRQKGSTKKRGGTGIWTWVAVAAIGLLSFGDATMASRRVIYDGKFQEPAAAQEELKPAPVDQMIMKDKLINKFNPLVKSITRGSEPTVPALSHGSSPLPLCRGNGCNSHTTLSEAGLAFK